MEDIDAVDIIPNSLCMHCGGSGTTRLLIHKIPYFREVIIASFQCEYSNLRDEIIETEEIDIPENHIEADAKGCGYTNNEITFGGAIQPNGVIYELKVLSKSDLDRQVIKADTASISIPEIEFEIPPNTQKGEISTIEGFLSRAAKVLYYIKLIVSF